MNYELLEESEAQTLLIRTAGDQFNNFGFFAYDNKLQDTHSDNETCIVYEKCNTCHFTNQTYH
jgi:hypothetical protein